mgnify:FL=1|jgi:hypothetical protein
MDVLKYIGLIVVYLFVYSVLNTPYNYYFWALGEDSAFANNLWWFVAVVKLGITYVFLRTLNTSSQAILIVLFTASTARLVLSLPFPVVIIGYVMYFTKWLTISLKKLKLNDNNV